MRYSLAVLPLAAVFAAATACSGDKLTAPATSSPQIDSVAPSWGSPGTEVRLHGTNFNADTVSVFFGTFPAVQVRAQSASLTLAVAPDQLPAGMYDVRIVNPDGGADVLAQSFELVTPPVADSISPRRGTVGTDVRIHGASFADSVTVFFNDLESPRVVLEAGSLFATAPEGLTLGTMYDVRVVNRERAADTLVTAFEAVVPNVVRVNGVTKPTALSECWCSSRTTPLAMSRMAPFISGMRTGREFGPRSPTAPTIGITPSS